jgi:hypothetical protein
VREAGFVVDGDSAVESVTFTDIGAFAWYLSVIPWIVPASPSTCTRLGFSASTSEGRRS